MNVESTSLFSERAKDYANYRPSYAENALEVLHQLVNVPAEVADIGAGTGIFTRQLLQSGYHVSAVEPNAAMRAQSQCLCEAYPHFTPIEGQGENTHLPDASIDLITIAQAFHWLDRPLASAEFHRISRNDAKIAVIWNTRKFNASSFMTGYKKILDDMCPDYKSVSVHWENMENDICSFIQDDSYQRYSFINNQEISLEMMIGNLVSTSYMPKPNETGYDRIIELMTKLFYQYAVDGKVSFMMDTILVTGQVDTP